MLFPAIAAMAVTIVVALAWRNAWAPAVGALLGLVLVVSTGAAEARDLEDAARELWRPLLVIVSIMATATCAGELGVFGYLADLIEPRTRGPVKHAFRIVFVLAALCAAVLSNDAAILMFTPVVIELLRQVYPKRNPKFLVPFAFAVFVAAGVAPLPTGNPMNLVVASRAGIRFHEYALHMIPVAIAGWLVAYAALAWVFRDALSDEAPALGKRTDAKVPMDPAARIVLVAAGVSIALYPIMALVGWPLWRVAVPTAAICILVTLRRRVSLPVSFRAIAGGISWELLPFVYGVFVLATVLARAGVTGHLGDLYASPPAPLTTVRSVSACARPVHNNPPDAPHLPPDPGHFVPAKRQRWIERAVAVDPHRPRFDSRNHPVYRRQVVRPDTRAQPIRTVIGHAQRIGFIIERNRHQHRAEDLFLHQRVLLVDIDNHRPLDEKPWPELLAAAGDGRATFPAFFDVPVHPFLLASGNQRPHLDAWVQTVAEFHGIGDVGDVRHHIVEMLALHIQPGACAADLALIEENCAGGPGCGCSQVGIGHDDGW